MSLNTRVQRSKAIDSAQDTQRRESRQGGAGEDEYQG